MLGPKLTFPIKNTIKTFVHAKLLSQAHRMFGEIGC